MSLINFLNPKLKPSVECECVCADGYSAGNLIADDLAEVSRGFMAYHVTKPPIEIVFDFPKAIDLKVIKLWNSINNMHSSAFEVHSKFEGIWERVGFVRDLDKGVDSVTFCYQSDYNSRSDAANQVDQKPSEKVFFFRSARRILSNTNSIKIIIRATHKCPPVLRTVQVWGLPSRALEKVDRELIKTIWSEITNPYGEDAHLQSGQRSPSRCLPELNEQSALVIPEEFLDAITWELMIFPTVLPSGKVVDQSTIDRHSEVESKWGRMPSDPFTGLEFTSHRKAILNAALKARIEKFLMENSEQFKTVPRSLGSSRVRRSRNRHASQFASICHTSTTQMGTYSVLTAGKYNISTVTATRSSTSDPLPAKRAKLCEKNTTSTTTTSTSRAYRKDVPLYTSTATQTSATATVSFSSSLSTSASVTASSPTDIDQAIQEALKKITRYTKPPTETTTQSYCIRCKSEDYTYEILTCKHVTCRGCLVHLMQEKMCICKKIFHSADVERYHKL